MDNFLINNSNFIITVTIKSRLSSFYHYYLNHYYYYCYRNCYFFNIIIKNLRKTFFNSTKGLKEFIFSNYLEIIIRKTFIALKETIAIIVWTNDWINNTYIYIYIYIY